MRPALTQPELDHLIAAFDRSQVLAQLPPGVDGRRYALGAGIGAALDELVRQGFVIERGKRGREREGAGYELVFTKRVAIATGMSTGDAFFERRVEVPFVPAVGMTVQADERFEAAITSLVWSPAEPRVFYADCGAAEAWRLVDEEAQGGRFVAADWAIEELVRRNLADGWVRIDPFAKEEGS